MSNFNAYHTPDYLKISTSTRTLDTLSCSETSSFCCSEDEIGLLPQSSQTETETKATTNTNTHDVLAPESILKKTKPPSTESRDVGGELPKNDDESLHYYLEQQVSFTSLQSSTSRSRRSSGDKKRFNTENERRQRTIDIEQKWHKTCMWSLED